MKNKTIIKIITGLVLAVVVLCGVELLGMKWMQEREHEPVNAIVTRELMNFHVNTIVETTQLLGKEALEASGAQVQEEETALLNEAPAQEAGKILSAQVQEDGSDSFEESVITFVTEADEAVCGMLDQMEETSVKESRGQPKKAH